MAYNEDLRAIRAEFERLINHDTALLAMTRRMENGTGAMEDVYRYASRVSSHLSRAIKSRLALFVSDDAHYEIELLQALISPMLINTHGLVNQAFMVVQQQLNENNGLGLSPLVVSTNDEDRQSRIDGISNRMVELEKPEADAFMEQAIENYNLSLVDEDQKANAEFQAISGLKVTVKRETRGAAACQWCKALAGTYNYEDIRGGSEVWARHRGCFCILTFNSQKTVWGGDTNDRWKWKAAPNSTRNKNENGYNPDSVMPIINRRIERRRNNK